MSEVARFLAEVAHNIEHLTKDEDVHALSRIWIREVTRHKYAYNFTWMGRPIIQLPQDMIALQELVWRIRPEVIVETGVAHGGSLVYYASLLEMLGAGKVIGVDIDIREHNRAEIECHPMSKRISLVSGSSIDPSTVAKVGKLLAGAESVLVLLDSNHTHDHVFAELELYSPFVTSGSYLVVFDTIIEDMPEDFFADRSWGKGNNPKTAVREFLRTRSDFEIDKQIESKLLITVAPDGYLRRR